MKLPVAIESLPKPIAAAVTRAKKSELVGEAIAACEDYLADGGKRTPEVLILFAYLLYFDAVTVMVDEVPARGARALALLDEAKQPRKTAVLRRDIAAAVARAKKAEARVDKMRGDDLASLSPSALREVAFRLGESADPADQAKSARAWELVAKSEPEAFDKHDALGRAALAYADAGDWTEALPRLEKILKSPRKYEDWLPDYAHYRLLDKAIADRDPATFRKRWTAALAMKREDHFPFAHPRQDAYLAYAVANKLPEIAKHVAAIVTAHRKPRERKALQKLLDRAAKL